MIFSTIACYNNPDFEGNEIVGYTGILLSAAFIFVGIKNYRDKYKQGLITFGEAFKVGFLIALIASTVYVLVWLVEYYVFMPDFMDRYIAHMMDLAKKKGATAAQLASKDKDFDMYRSIYKNPVLIILATYMEVLPISTLVALISAAILKRRGLKPSGVVS